ncbi:tetratricopeptide repeat protein [Pelagibacterium luteolum]|uniref:TPR repeat n=1 Tax=Pelagibacterium luteolum TaxID=440168 RepID=A0A1G7SP40_9HYPH|nr:tetratricopeptide repeat protein [Pelagibacterium luteolum]SDG24835.1 TPR repeat [Pelagibacterium luteolum]
MKREAMMIARWVGGCVLAVAVTTGPVLANEIARCADLAANPFQPGYERTGVDQRDLDVAAAVDACTAALAANPSDIDVRAWLARAYFVGRQFDAMYPHVEIAAEAGNALAQQLFGDALVAGHAIEPDWPRSVPFLMGSAEQGYAPGQYSLGLSYLYGEGVDADPDRAAELFGFSAAQGFSHAKTELGLLKVYGEGVDADVAGGLALLRDAAADRESFAMLQLGHLYYDGDLVDGDRQRALAWYLDADAAGESNAAGFAALLYLGKDGSERDLDAARRLAEKAIAAEDGFGHFVLGQIAELGLAGAINIEEARAQYQAGADLDDAASQEALAALAD